MKPPIISAFGFAVLAAHSLITPSFAVVNIDYVTIGNAGNAADGTTYGAVAYDYKIAKNETTIALYAEFLNAVAKTDTYGLYSASMTTSYINGITQSGVPGSFTYSVAAGSGNKPITYVSWFNAARFTNWMHNGQPVGAQGVTTTEDGAYTLNGATSGIITKNATATVWLPSENEWYKAAYYDPNKGGAGVGGYWLYPTQSNTMTTNDFGVAGAANFADANGYATYVGGASWGITDVGAYGLNSESAYGTNDQGGNVAEWNDAVILGSARGVRAGHWNNGDSDLISSYRYSIANPEAESAQIGFRVASVIPEPTSVVLAMFASGMLLVRRRS